MADNRADLEKNLVKLSGARDRIAAQLEEAEKKVTQLQGVVNNEMMQTGTSDSLQELSVGRERITSLHLALQFANSQVKAAQQQLSDYDMTVRGGQIQELDKKMIQAVVDLQGKLGELGWKGELDKLGSMIAELVRLSSSNVKIQDVDQHIQSARVIYGDLTNALLKAWNQIDGLKWGPAHSSTPTQSGYLPGFGKLPDHI